jgi:hypothetical protein
MVTLRMPSSACARDPQGFPRQPVVIQEKKSTPVFKPRNPRVSLLLKINIRTVMNMRSNPLRLLKENHCETAEIQPKTRKYRLMVLDLSCLTRLSAG